MHSPINSLADLEKYRSAPKLDKQQESILLQELSECMKNADWFTVGIMATSCEVAIVVLQEMETYFGWSPMKVTKKPEEINTPVFLKANQNTGDIYIRTEFNLGEGILLTCQNYQENKNANTFGPLPLDFFRVKV